MSDLIDDKGYGHSDMEPLFVLPVPQEKCEFMNVANRIKKQICMDINVKISGIVPMDIYDFFEFLGPDSDSPWAKK